MKVERDLNIGMNSDSILGADSTPSLADIDKQARETLPPSEGWGIIKTTGGLARLDTTEQLIDVLEDQKVAEELASALSAQACEDILEDSTRGEDPDNPEDYEVYFARPVVRRSVELTFNVTAAAEYDIVKPEQQPSD